MRGERTTKKSGYSEKRRIGLYPFILIQLLLRFGRCIEKDYVKELGLDTVHFPKIGRCILNIELKERKLLATSENGQIAQIFPSTENDDSSWSTPQLCVDQKPNRIAILTIASDLAYMRKYEAFAWNKICYSDRANLRFLLFLGIVPEAANAPGPRCTKHQASMHWIKNIAMYTALFTHNDNLSRSDTPLEEILVLDTDAIFTQPSFDHRSLLDCYRAVASDYHVSMFAGSEHYQVFLNAAVLYAKRTSWTRALLSLWWRDRCGEKDQLVLWSSLFRLWSLDEARLHNYHDQLLDYVERGSYRKKTNVTSKNATYMYARRVLTFEIARHAFPNNFMTTRSPSGRIMIKESDLLYFPHFIFFPLTKLKPNVYKDKPMCPSEVPPFRGVVHNQKRSNEHRVHAFIFHTKHPPNFDSCSPSSAAQR
uniref:Uncharacterized protein n=1 Tax=Aureoumbra lagunensis TaxID=44058 RepID=A0A7S3NMM0_9STRA